MRITKKHLIAFSLLLPLTSANAAIINTFTNSTDFTNTVGSTSLEDFNSFASDTPFHSSSLDVGDFTLSMTGTAATYANQVDASPVRFSQFDVDGTTMLDVFTDASSSFLLTFDTGISSFGADLKAFNNVVFRTNIFVDGVLLAPPVNALNFQNTFFGFQSDSLFTTVEFIGVQDDGFGMDNVRYGASSVPEPSVVALFGLGLAGIGFARRRRK
jgi:hypothetical protein